MLVELIAASGLAVLAAVGIHFEFLQLAYKVSRMLPGPRRIRVAVAILVAVIAHLVEVGVFALAWVWCLRRGLAALSIPDPNVLELFYFSGSVYTSLGFGDVISTGGGMVLVVVEAVTGLVLIAWTASFTFVEMQENWRVVRR